MSSGRHSTVHIYDAFSGDWKTRSLAFPESPQILTMPARALGIYRGDRVISSILEELNLPCGFKFFLSTLLDSAEMQVPDARIPPLRCNSVSVLFQCRNSSMQNFPFYPQFLHEKCLSGPPREVTRLPHLMW